MGTHRLVGITNSLRQTSLNRMTMALVDELLPAHCCMEMIDLRPLPFYDTDLEKQGYPRALQAIAATLAHADGVIITAPEYNHSIPAVLKNAIDWLSRVPQKPLNGMPVMILSATPGMLGGARMQYDLRRVLEAVGALPLVRPEVFIGHADSKFDAQGRCIDARTRDMVGAQIQAFEDWMERLAVSRQAVGV
jgi:chromate reductase